MSPTLKRPSTLIAAIALMAAPVFAAGSANVDVATPTFHNEVSRILQAECQVCHEPTDESLPLGNNGPHGMHPVAGINEITNGLHQR